MTGAQHREPSRWAAPGASAGGERVEHEARWERDRDSGPLWLVLDGERTPYDLVTGADPGRGWCLYGAREGPDWPFLGAYVIGFNHPGDLERWIAASADELMPRGWGFRRGLTPTTATRGGAGTQETRPPGLHRCRAASSALTCSSCSSSRPMRSAWASILAT
jgi:hypothetical protein